MSKEEFNKRECARDCKYNKKHDEKCHCEEKKPITKEQQKQSYKLRLAFIIIRKLTLVLFI